MTNPVNSAIHRDVGGVWDAIEGTTTTIVDDLITKAQNKIKAITGTTTGENQDLAIRALADVYAINNVLGGLGPETIADKNMREMRDEFKMEASDALKSIGYSLDGKSIKFSQVNP